LSDVLAGRVAIVTGGSRGVGYAIAYAYINAGAKVIVASRKAAAVADAVKQLDVIRGPGNVTGVTVDVTSNSAAAELVAAAKNTYGRVDILVNCAGAFIYKPLLDLTAAEWELSLATNMTAPFVLTQELGRYFVAQQSGGCIINITSVHGSIADANGAAQSASKFGLEGLTKAAAEALRPFDVRVNAIAPGAIARDSATVMGQGPRGKVTQLDVANFAVYLASDVAKTITGATIELFGVTRPTLTLA
jgi:NAD(P)-dependent dehydrogenase (short-subunit alcohol dehydrogenase family)